jgi:hypothetical protein
MCIPDQSGFCCSDDGETWDGHEIDSEAPSLHPTTKQLILQTSHSKSVKDAARNSSQDVADYPG